MCPSPPSGTGAADSWGALTLRPGQAKGRKAGGRPECKGVAVQLGLQPCTPRGVSRAPGRGSRLGAPPGADTGALHPVGARGGPGRGTPRRRHRRPTEASSPHLGQVHLGGQQGPGRTVRQRQVLRQEAPQLPPVPGHRVQREGGHWTDRRTGLKAGPTRGQSAPEGLRAELPAAPTVAGPQ